MPGIRRQHFFVLFLGQGGNMTLKRMTVELELSITYEETLIEEGM